MGSSLNYRVPLLRTLGPQYGTSLLRIKGASTTDPNLENDPCDLQGVGLLAGLGVYLKLDGLVWL